MPSTKEISLLPNEENNNSALARILRWATTVGRVIIIITEFIVIGAFLSRFWLDRKNSDLSEVLRQQKAILNSTKDFEADYTSLQQRLLFIKNFYQSEPKYVNILNSMVQSLPNGIYLNGLNLTRDKKNSQVSILAQLYSYEETSIANFIANVRLNPDVSNVEVQKIEKKTKDSKYYVSVTITFKKT